MLFAVLGLFAFVSYVYAQEGEVFQELRVFTADENLKRVERVSGVSERDLVADKRQFCVLRAKFGTYRDYDEFLACKEVFNDR